MKKIISIFPLLALFLGLLSINPVEADAAYKSTFFNDQTQSYFYVGIGWGSVEYDFYQEEDWSYNLTYKVGTSTRRQVSINAQFACPFVCELRFDNKYYNAGSGSYITGQSMYAMSAGSYWSHIWPSGRKTYNYISPLDISTDVGQKLKVKTTMGLWIQRSGSWYFGSSKDHWGYYY